VHSFGRYRNSYLRNFTACPESILDFWLGWGSEGMGAHYDKIFFTRSLLGTGLWAELESASRRYRLELPS
jgi:hypothetical protein